MKTLILIIAFCMVTLQYTNAQETEKEEVLTADEAQFAKAATYYEEGDLRSAAAEFRKLMVEYPLSPLVPRAHYNVAYISFNLKDYGTAKLIFEEILNKPYNELDSNDIMEPYTLYKHHTCRLLAEIALQEKDYAAAEKYIQLFEKKYPYQHFCGNELSAYDMYAAVMRARLYEGTDQVQKAMDALLPYVFTQALASNEEVLNELSTLLERNFSKEAIHQEFTRSLASLTVKKTKRQQNATVMLYGTKVEIEDFFYEDESNKKTLSMDEHYKNIIKENALYKKFL